MTSSAEARDGEAFVEDLC